MVTFAIDRIPSLADARPYASYILLEEGQSDGVPERISDEDTDSMPEPPRCSVLLPVDDTIPMRKPL